jgi:hypothetical protein
VVVVGRGGRVKEKEVGLVNVVPCLNYCEVSLLGDDRGGCGLG